MGRKDWLECELDLGFQFLHVNPHSKKAKLYFLTKAAIFRCFLINDATRHCTYKASPRR